MPGSLAIQTHPAPQYEFKGSQYDHLPKVPLRGLVLGPSGSGKGVFLCDLICRLYRGCFERVYVWSPSVDLDHQWDAVKKYSSEVLGVDQSKEKTFFNTWDESEINKVIADHTAVTLQAKKRGMRKLYSILIVIDDFADMRQVIHSSHNACAQLFIRGRHAGISTIVSSQKLTLLDPVLRTQATFLCVFRLRNGREYQSLIEELSALYPPDVLREMYQAATEDKYSFWYINLAAHDKREMFFLRFDGGAMVPHEEEPWGSPRSRRPH